ncbi:MAG: hypothetical protein LUD81_06615, partial [Clostridiales bacterium]|nr:hypothetical protein [Clostridiales bacterium]
MDYSVAVRVSEQLIVEVNNELNERTGVLLKKYCNVNSVAELNKQLNTVYIENGKVKYRKDVIANM